LVTICPFHVRKMGCATHWEFLAGCYLRFMETDQIREKAKNWQETAQEVSDEARESMRDWQRRAAETARNTSRAIDDYVHENSWMSLAIAAALGCAIGLLLSRSRE
jgi:ElaB/YqjD/DUF883 family membrane-anchored ribosome-binding protein